MNLDLPNFDAAKNYVLQGRTLNRIMRQIRRVAPIAGAGITTTETPNGVFIGAQNPEEFEQKIPFKLSATETTFTVSSYLSTIIDGTNGNAISIGSAGFDSAIGYSGKKYVVLEATVDAGFGLSDWTIKGVAQNDAKEVFIDDTLNPDRQTKLRLLIGTVDNSRSEWAEQFIFTAQRVTFGLLNGLAVKVFEPAGVWE